MRWLHGPAVVAAAFLLSGCFGEVLLRVDPRSSAPLSARDSGSSQRTFALTFTARLTRPGRSRIEPPGRTVRGSVYKGSFRTTNLGPVRRAGRGLQLAIGRGTWVARINGEEDHTHGVATERGLALARFADRPTGNICFSYVLRTRNHGLSHTGTFTTIGGTGKVARVAATGTATNRPAGGPNPAGGNGTTSGRGTYRTLRRARGLSRACAALRRL
jgi:hypothetical protein